MDFFILLYKSITFKKVLDRNSVYRVNLESVKSHERTVAQVKKVPDYCPQNICLSTNYGRIFLKKSIFRIKIAIKDVASRGVHRGGGLSEGFCPDTLPPNPFELQIKRTIPGQNPLFFEIPPLEPPPPL